MHSRTFSQNPRKRGKSHHKFINQFKRFQKEDSNEDMLFLNLMALSNAFDFLFVQIRLNTGTKASSSFFALLA